MQQHQKNNTCISNSK